ncbi:DUF4959 domain-containing protein [Mucilaginibacter sp. SMC90]|uniref:DUF4959 domain-containing protein n=1 Tax=Mucilaginibacter sp. SMC90 TaxID=2929803 RepID=UPI001FB2C94D|nr:DUF4959 domain-containing protein [Mucilaginibacter sp. SMC90]UOE47222.1 DUF4959 domain-containing protein [Mucilaginibacter sp. SMC90]
MSYNHIKPVHFICVLALLTACLFSCSKSDNYKLPESTDKTKPAVVTNVKVRNFNGGAVLTYTLPSSQNLLYVVADYNINGKTTRQTKSSYFLDTIRVDGFQSSKDYTITLHAVTRANVESDPVTVTVHPDTPYYQLIRKNLTLAADFGGVHLSTINKDKRPVGVNLIAIDPADNKFNIKDRHFTSTDTISYAVRGFSTTPAKFGAFVTDQFGNTSDTLLVTLTPLYEELLDKSKFFPTNSPSDAFIGYGGILPYLWDGFTKEVGGAAPWQTTIGSVQKLVQGTFGVGRSYKLSHFLMWPRGYGYANPKVFSIWGSNKDNPADAVTPGGKPVGTVSGDWVVVGTYRFPDPPSGLPQGQTNAADQAFVEAGVNFDVPFDSPAVKYLRVVVSETWFGLDYTYIEEMSFYGIPQ